MTVCTQCQNSLLPERARCVLCQQSGGPPWEPSHLPDTSLERVPITLSIVRADGGTPNAFPIVQSEVFLSAEAELLSMDSPSSQSPMCAAGARIRLQENGLFIEAIDERDGLFRRIQAEEALLLPCELRMGRHRFLLEELEACEQPHQPEFWGASPAPFRARLIDLLQDNLIGDVFVLREGINVVGREKGDIVCHPTDNFISGRHAQFDVDGNLILLSDLNSSNGTFVRVHGPHPIFDGDQFLMGPHLLTFTLTADG